MALTTTQELNITSGLVGPDAYSLLDYVHQTGVQYAEDFMTEYKIFPTVDGEGQPISQLATSYLNKMISACQKMIKADGAAINSLMRIDVVLLGEVAPSYEFIETMDDETWSNFLKIVSRQAFELVSAVRQEEKAEYDNLPEA